MTFLSMGRRNEIVVYKCQYCRFDTRHVIVSFFSGADVDWGGCAPWAYVPARFDPCTDSSCSLLAQTAAPRWQTWKVRASLNLRKKVSNKIKSSYVLRRYVSMKNHENCEAIFIPSSNLLCLFFSNKRDYLLFNDCPISTCFANVAILLVLAKGLG